MEPPLAAPIEAAVEPCHVPLDRPPVEPVIAFSAPMAAEPPALPELPPEPVAPPVEPAATAAPTPSGEEFATRAFRLSEILEPPPGAPASASSPEPEPRRGRVLADLYYAQGHFAEALRIYDDLVVANPGDAELKARRREAEARLLPGATTPEAAAPDPILGRRLARIRVLKRWLAVVQTG
jgi:hypothetical protein